MSPITSFPSLFCGSGQASGCYRLCAGKLLSLLIACFRSGVGAPVIGEIDGEYRHDSRRNLLEWCLPVIDAKNKSGSLEFSIAGQPNDFFPVQVSFISKKNYCNIQVWSLLMLYRWDVTLASVPSWLTLAMPQQHHGPWPG